MSKKKTEERPGAWTYVQAFGTMGMIMIGVVTLFTFIESFMARVYPVKDCYTQYTEVLDENTKLIVNTDIVCE